MTRAGLLAWAAWAPGREGEEAWRAWSRSPVALEPGDPPEARFLPLLQRRRCDALSRMLLHVAHACCDEARRARVACVVASRHGPFATTISLLQGLARDEPVSPARFSHSVHNTQAGLFSIWAGNRAASSSLAAREETFVHGFVEALGLLQRGAAPAVLLLCGDERLPDAVAHLAPRHHGPHAVGLLLGSAAEGPSVELALEPASEPPAPLEWPEALGFVRWWLSGEPRWRRSHGPRVWTFSRSGADGRAS